MSDIAEELNYLAQRFDVATANLADAKEDHDHLKTVRALTEMLNIVRGTGRLLELTHADTPTNTVEQPD